MRDPALACILAALLTKASIGAEEPSGSPVTPQAPVVVQTAPPSAPGRTGGPASTPAVTDLSAQTSLPAQRPALPGHFAILAGGGQSFPGWGKTTERVKTIDLTLRYAGLINRPHDFGFIHTREQLWIEFPVLYVYEPDNAPILSINFLYCCLLEQFDSWQPYFTAGGGPVYAIADIPGMGSRLCGNYQAGVGIRIPTAGRALHVEARFHHISNLGAADPNVPINSLRGLLGVSWDF